LVTLFFNSFWSPGTLDPLAPVFYLFRLRPAYRAIEFPQVQEAHMPSFRAAGALVQRVIAYRACFHDGHYTLLKRRSSIKRIFLMI
jgi:hypothetical protein